MLTLLYSVLPFVVIAIVVYCVWRAVDAARTPQGAAGWAVFLIAAPWFAVPAFLVFGTHKLRRYNQTRKKTHDVVQRLAASRDLFPPRADPAKRLSVFEQLAEMPALGGNDARLLLNGEEGFPAIFAAIDRAERYVCVQSYTFYHDAVGNALADHLIAAVGRGVSVRLLYDGAGSYKLSRKWITRLNDAGVKVLDPRGGSGPSSKLNINFRNHRKTVLIDGVEGFVGGLNMSQTYVDGGAEFDRWRDTHLHMKGPIISQLQLAFVEDWHWACEELLSDELEWHPPAQPSDMTGVIISAGPNDDLDTGALFFASAISQARSRIWIASPYFVPDSLTLGALTNAALRGCDVRIIMPERADHYLTWLAAYDYFDEVREAGVRIFRYQPGFMHQKVVLVDDEVAAVGTMNFDYRSFRLNFETMAIFHHTGFAHKVSDMLTTDLADCIEFETPLYKQPLYLRVAAPLARLAAPIL